MLVHAQTEDDFLTRLKSILERLERRGLVLSPSKCSFGMQEVEILGHTIDKEGTWCFQGQVSRQRETLRLF